MPKKTVYGIGFIGDGEYSCRDFSGKMTKSYSVWSNMLRRCYTSYNSDKWTSLYKNVEVHEDWLNYQNFAEWYNRAISKFVQYNVEPKLDKDLLSENNLLYSKETCCILPNIINSSIIKRRVTNGEHHGVYIKNGKYYVGITRKGKLKNIPFDTKEEAHLNYVILKKEYIQELAHEYKDVLDEVVFKKLLEWEP